MKVYYIPNGPKNLETIFPGIDFNSLQEYYIEVYDDEVIPNQIATFPINYMDNCKSSLDKVRVHFINYLGSVDPINFKRVETTHMPKSSSYQKKTTNPLDNTVHSISRFNVKSNDQMTLTTVVNITDDSQRDYYDELLDSPMAWIEVPSKNTYYSVVILDSDIQKIGPEDKFQYEVIIKVKFSHERFIIRN